MKFLVVGDVTVDHIYHLEELPDLGQEVQPHRLLTEPGGAGGTIAVTLARLGHEVALAACVGDDPYAEVALREVRDSGVSEELVQVVQGQPTSVITVMQTAEGQRTMLGHGGANRFLNPAKLRKKDVEWADAVIISAYSLVEGLQRDYALKAIDYVVKAKRDIPLFVDLGTGAVNRVGLGLIDNVEKADYLSLNQSEILALTETKSISAALSKLGQRGLEHVAVKVGALGCIVWTPSETELIDAVIPEDEEILDSTGAGDTFTAAFAHAVLCGKSLTTAGRMANAAGGLAATRPGAQVRHITEEDLAPYAD